MQRGLIPGPEESEAHFRERVKRSPSLGKVYPVKLFDIAPDWVDIHYSNQGLLPWEAAATWIEPSGAVNVQLREAFIKKKALFAFYDKEEMIQHEMVHAARAAFNEPLFEEFLAYLTSKSRVRAFLGTLIVRRFELSLAFISLLFPPLCFILLSLALLRSFRRQRQWKKSCHKLSFLVAKPEALLFCCTDREIILFSKSTLKEIVNYISLQSDFRWKEIKVRRRLWL